MRPVELAGILRRVQVGALRLLATAMLLAFGPRAIRADISLPILTAPESKVTIKFTSPCVSVPHFGFLPVRVAIENFSPRDGVWQFQFEVGNRVLFPGSSTASFEIAAPALQTRDAWFFVPLIEPGLIKPPMAASATAANPLASSGLMAASPPLAAGRVAMPTSPSKQEADALKIVTSTGLLTVPASVTSKPTTRRLPVPSRGAALPQGSAVMTLFEQTGPASELPLPKPGSLPAGVTVTLHPADSGSSEVLRVIAYIDPVWMGTLRANTLAASFPHTLFGSLFARAELTRLGYLRPLPNVSTSTGTRSGPRAPGMPRNELLVFTESGPVGLLRAPAAGILPNGITCTVTPGALPGEVSRNFIVDLNLLVPGIRVLPPPGAGARASAAARAGGVTLQHTFMNITVSGPGLPGGQSRYPFPSIAPGAMPPMAVSADLEAPLVAKLASSVARASLNFAPVNAAQLPADWRVWSSFNSVVLKGDEYAALDAGRRAALNGWIALGGLLYISPTQAGSAGTRRVGAGRVEILEAPIDEMTQPELAAVLPISTLAPGMPNRENLRFAPGTAMGEIVRFVAPGTFWVSLFLVAFAVVVGPVNLYLLAPRKKRYRLFLTTPLISAAGAVAVVVAIVLQDGLGGDGARRSLVVLLPGENQAAVFQEQAARTGFLLSRDFPLPDSVLCAILPADEGLFTGLIAPAGVTRDDSMASGDWFRNRSRQGHLLRTVIPTRARVEIIETTAAGAPVVESTLATELKDFRLRDGAGTVWSAASVVPGRRSMLIAERQGALAAADPREAFGDGSGNLSEILDSISQLGAWQWTARGGATDLAPIKTLAAIRWTDEDILYTGVLGRAPSLKTTTAAAPIAVEKEKR